MEKKPKNLELVWRLFICVVEVSWDLLASSCGGSPPGPGTSADVSGVTKHFVCHWGATPSERLCSASPLLSKIHPTASSSQFGSG